MPYALPKEYEFAHGLCIHLHNELVAVVKGLALGGHLSVTISRRAGIVFPDSTVHGEALFDWLEQNGYEDVVSKMYIRTLFPALLTDYCHFTLEALNCSAKGKLTVAYAMLRKPLRDNLFQIERLAAEPDTFVGRFHDRPATEMALEEHIQAAQVLPTIAAAVARTPVPEMYDADVLYMLRYDREAPESFAGMFDKALHLVTRFRAIRTEPRNLNFIFSDDRSETSQWLHLYTRLPLILSYTLDLSLMLAGGLMDLPLPPMRDMLVHRQISLALWLDDCRKMRTGKLSSHNSSRLLRTMGLRCSRCSTAIKGKRALRSLYMVHSVKCPGCGAPANISEISTRSD